MPIKNTPRNNGGANSPFGMGQNKNPKTKFPLLTTIYILVGVALISYWMFAMGGGQPVDIDDMSFNQMVRNKEIDHIEYVRKDDRVNVFLKKEALQANPAYEKIKDNVNGPQFFITVTDLQVFNDNLKEVKSQAVQEALASDSTLNVSELSREYDFPTKQDNSKSWGFEVIFWILPMAMIILLFYYSTRTMRGGMGGGSSIFNIGKSRAQEFDEKSGQLVTFKDVAGLEGAKFEIEEVVDFLKNPQKYTVLGGKIPKGVLLVGPPGTGKTLLAKAVAGEAKVPFFSLSVKNLKIKYLASLLPLRHIIFYSASIYCAGVIPVCFLNIVWKYERELKPQLSAIVSMLQSGCCFSSRFASSSRRCVSQGLNSSHSVVFSHCVS